MQRHVGTSTDVLYTGMYDLRTKLCTFCGFVLPWPPATLVYWGFHSPLLPSFPNRHVTAPGSLSFISHSHTHTHSLLSFLFIPHLCHCKINPSYLSLQFLFLKIKDSDLSDLISSAFLIMKNNQLIYILYYITYVLQLFV